MALLLTDLIRMAGVELGRFKVHLATNDENPPLAAYFAGTFREWQEYQTRRNFPCDRVLSLIEVHRGKWLFAGVWNIHGVTEKQDSDKKYFEYATTEVTGLEHLVGRAIVSYQRKQRAPYRVGLPFANSLVVSQLLEEPMRMADFSGFASVLITYDQLRHIVTTGLTSWRAALESVAGVYLVTDLSCGKLYVGSAYGVEGIWGRWSAYTESGHGGNKELAQLLAGVGSAHAKHFQFSILEICDIKAPKDDVIVRETHWKNALQSRRFGYNAN